MDNDAKARLLYLGKTFIEMTKNIFNHFTVNSDF